MKKESDKIVLIDGSRIIIEALAQTGAQVYAGYPITPANWLYSYAHSRFPTFLAAPDEITALQWAAGFSATGKLPVTGTSFPGLALMMETLNMAFMMELPVVIVLAQRMGPSTGSATTGAQGDLLLLRGAISGGYTIPVFCPSDLTDCWELASQSAAAAIKLRTPVILLTSKEMIMTKQSFDLSQLQSITPAQWCYDKGKENYQPYQSAPGEAPPFLAAGNDHRQVRLNASTHDASGLIKKATPEALANTRRLQEKIERRISEFTFYEYQNDEGADTLIVTYGISAGAARKAVQFRKSKGNKVSLLVLKTLLPVPPSIFDILSQYDHLVFVEENLSGLLTEILFGKQGHKNIRSVNQIGRMITPSEIEGEVASCSRVS